jgi:hypothetical protein
MFLSKRKKEKKISKNKRDFGDSVSLLHTPTIDRPLLLTSSYCFFFFFFFFFFQRRNQPTNQPAQKQQMQKPEPPVSW